MQTPQSLAVGEAPDHNFTSLCDNTNYALKFFFVTGLDFGTALRYRSAFQHYPLMRQISAHNRRQVDSMIQDFGDLELDIRRKLKA